MGKDNTTTELAIPDSEKIHVDTLIVWLDVEGLNVEGLVSHDMLRAAYSRLPAHEDGSRRPLRQIVHELMITPMIIPLYDFRMPTKVGPVWWLAAPALNKKRRQAADRVYFIQESSDGPVRITHANADPTEHLAEMQRGNHRELQVVATAFGAAELAKVFHRHFHEYRLGGDWFKPAADVQRHIALIRHVEETLKREPLTDPPTEPPTQPLATVADLSARRSRKPERKRK